MLSTKKSAWRLKVGAASVGAAVLALVAGTTSASAARPAAAVGSDSSEGGSATALPSAGGRTDDMFYGLAAWRTAQNADPTLDASSDAAAAAMAPMGAMSRGPVGPGGGRAEGGHLANIG
jgi:hypothetical protein